MRPLIFQRLPSYRTFMYRLTATWSTWSGQGHHLLVFICSFVICVFVICLFVIDLDKWSLIHCTVSEGGQDLLICLLVILFFFFVFACLLLTNDNPLQGFGMPLAGYLIHWIGARPAIATGCLIFSSGTALTYFTLNMVRYFIMYFCVLM